MTRSSCTSRLQSVATRAKAVGRQARRRNQRSRQTTGMQCIFIVYIQYRGSQKLVGVGGGGTRAWSTAPPFSRPREARARGSTPPIVSRATLTCRRQSCSARRRKLGETRGKLARGARSSRDAAQHSGPRPRCAVLASSETAGRTASTQLCHVRATECAPPVGCVGPCPGAGACLGDSEAKRKRRLSRTKVLLPRRLAASKL